MFTPRITQLTIERFKSIRALSLECRKVNLFIGAPDTGKTNILDALAFLSSIAWNIDFTSLLRLNRERGIDNLFYLNFTDKPIVVTIDGYAVSSTKSGPFLRLEYEQAGKKVHREIGFDLRTGAIPEIQYIRHYSYSGVKDWDYIDPQQFHGIVAIPNGGNLAYLANHHSLAHQCLVDLVAPLGFNLFFHPDTGRIAFAEIRDGTIEQYNFDLLSDTVKRMFFHSAILLTNTNSTIVLDEPDVYAFPPYPKNLGEMIAGDKTNQFFLTTHNPYFLSAIVEKTPKENLGLFVCSREKDGSTTTSLLSPDQISEVIALGENVFFNLDRFSHA